MRTLDELGISPAPWEAEVFADGHYAYITARSVNGNKKIVGSEHSTADARLIAAAPMLYEDLAEACREFCFRCKHKDDKDAADICDQCIVSGWKETLAASSGESDARVWCKHDPTRKCVDC